MILNDFNNTKLSHFLKYLTNMQNFTLMSVYAVATQKSHFSQKIHNSPPSLESSQMLKLPITLFPMLQHRCSYNTSALALPPEPIQIYD